MSNIVRHPLIQRVVAIQEVPPFSRNDDLQTF